VFSRSLNSDTPQNYVRVSYSYFYLHEKRTLTEVFGPVSATSCSLDRADNGSAGHGSWVKWVDKCKWVTWIMGQYRKTLYP